MDSWDPNGQSQESVGIRLIEHDDEEGNSQTLHKITHSKKTSRAIPLVSANANIGYFMLCIQTVYNKCEPMFLFG